MGLSCGMGIPSNLPCARLYTVTGIDVAADFATGIWVVAVVLTTLGLGSAGGVGLVGIGWAITLTLNLLFTGALALFFLLCLLGH